MAELTLTTMLSLDGVMQAPGGPEEDTSGGFAHGGWTFPLFDAGGGELVVANIARADAFLLGRGTYDIFAAYWPRVTDPAHPIAVPLNALPKHVASRTRTRFEWNRSEHVADVVRDVPALKARYLRELQVHGSWGLCQTLLKHDLVDEYRLLVFPVVLGGGKRLFGEGAVPASFSLVSSRATGTGVLLNVYRRAGALKTGTFALD